MFFWKAIRAVLPYRPSWERAKNFNPYPQDMAYTAFGQVPVTISPNSGGTIFGQIDAVAPGQYVDTHTVLVGQAPIFEGVQNQPLGYPGETLQ